jgi:hypothetical protein
MPEEAVILILGIFGLICSIPIVAIVTAHKRRMAEIQLEMIKAQGGGSEAQSLRHELTELKSLIYQQTLEADSMRQLIRGQASVQNTPPPAPQRINQGVGQNGGQNY